MARHPFRIREISVQAGLSEATVDRVLNGRGGVRDSTVRDVRAAIADLERQRDQVRLSEDNIRLLRGGRIAAVLYHDLRLDMRRACQVIMSVRNRLPDFAVTASAIQVVTPFNIPEDSRRPFDPRQAVTVSRR